MFYWNSVQLAGIIAQDPEDAGLTSKGQQVARFIVAIYDEMSLLKKNIYIQCFTFGKTAEFILKWAKKGTPIFLSGRIVQNEFRRGCPLEIAVTAVKLLGPATITEVSSEVPTMEESISQQIEEPPKSDNTKENLPETTTSEPNTSITSPTWFDDTDDDEEPPF